MSSEADSGGRRDKATSLLAYSFIFYLVRQCMTTESHKPKPAFCPVQTMSPAAVSPLHLEGETVTPSCSHLVMSEQSHSPSSFYFIPLSLNALSSVTPSLTLFPNRAPPTLHPSSRLPFPLCISHAPLWCSGLPLYIVICPTLEHSSLRAGHCPDYSCLHRDQACSAGAEEASH